MVKGVGVASMSKIINQYWVVGRQSPSEANPEPTCYRIRVFAKNTVIARSRFWYQMKRQNKVRRTQGEIVSVSQIFERSTNAVRNYGIVLKYNTRNDIVNMYKEYRDNSLCGAVSQMYSEMAGRHSARGDSIHIIKTVVVPDNAVKREQTKQYVRRGVKYPKITHGKRAPTPAHHATFTASRPTCI